MMENMYADCAGGSHHATHHVAIMDPGYIGPILLEHQHFHVV